MKYKRSFRGSRYVQKMEKNGNDENKQRNCVWKVGKRKMKY